MSRRKGIRWIPSVGRFQDAKGRWRKAPTWREIQWYRETKTGNWPLDDRDRQIPLSKIRGKMPSYFGAKKPRPTKKPAPLTVAERPATPRAKARRKKYLYEPDTGRWRDEKGHFSKAPLPQAIEWKGEIPIDSRGEPIPREELGTPRITDLARETPVKRTNKMPKNWATVDGHQAVKGRYEDFSHMNSQAPVEIEEVFDAALLGHLRKGGISYNDATLYEHGIVIRPQYGIVSAKLENEIREMLAGSGASITVIPEKPMVDTIKISFGDPKQPLTAEQVKQSFARRDEYMIEVWDRLVWEWDDCDWYAFWDTDEEMYELPAQ